ncbi:hypothetical protein GE09DRAFT_1219760 [Coniochaeta sp. 2T2.1]|nr:hypothetical protein GE09DRAFT_1219760 [Coniochaeta sp. 2T2.1]
MSLLTAEFLECTPYASVGPATTVLATSTVFLTSYTVTLPAACPTSEWEATYTITTTCTGDRAHWTAPAVPPEFAVTTVVCDVCAHKTQTITCPNAGATNVEVGGNGVTVTVAPTPAPTAAPAAPANTGAPAAGGGAPAAPGAGAPPAAESGAPAAGGGAPAASGGAAAAPGAPPAAESGAPAAGGAGAAPAPGAPTVTPINPPAATGTGADFVTVAGAPLSMKRSLGLMAGLALVAGQFLML